jgi:hypothetical protein
VPSWAQGTAVRSPGSNSERPTCAVRPVAGPQTCGGYEAASVPRRVRALWRLPHEDIEHQRRVPAFEVSRNAHRHSGEAHRRSRHQDPSARPSANVVTTRVRAPSIPAGTWPSDGLPSLSIRSRNVRRARMSVGSVGDGTFGSTVWRSTWRSARAASRSEVLATSRRSARDRSRNQFVRAVGVSSASVPSRRTP